MKTDFQTNGEMTGSAFPGLLRRSASRNDGKQASSLRAERSNPEDLLICILQNSSLAGGTTKQSMRRYIPDCFASPQ
jgi:hypothetical protein